MRNYVGTAVFITCMVLVLNFMLLAGLTLHYGTQSEAKGKISQIAREIQNSGDGYVLTDQGETLLNGYAWAFLLDAGGNVIWSYDTPEDFPERYTAADVAAFSKWYLDDYPVQCWKQGEKLLVVGEEKDSVWKHQMEFGMPFMKKIGSMFRTILLANGGLILLFCFFFGLHFSRSLRPLAAGIEDLAKEESIHLQEKGMTGELAEKLNQTSERLERQKAVIEARDTARTNWIAGVSHDIRTPLSMIMGYAEQLLSAENMDAEQKKQLGIIRDQGVKIKHLIEDLNLTSKLQYQMQPLRQEEFHPAKLMRQIVTSYYNNGLAGCYEIHFDAAGKVEPILITGDVSLLTRAFENLIGNSIRHNENGCTVDITMNTCTDGSGMGWLVTEMKDDGCGIPENVIQGLEEEQMGSGQQSGQIAGQPQTEKESVSRPYIMGLFVVKQIVLSHGGKFEIRAAKKGADIRVLLPLAAEKTAEKRTEQR